MVDSGTPASTFKGYDADEGGEIRMEYVRFADSTAAARVVAYFYANPGSTKYFPFPNLNGCTDMTMKKNWPMATNPIGERTYLDPGKIIISDGPNSLTVERNPPEKPQTDFLARTHPPNQWFFHFDKPSQDGLKFLPPKSSFDVVLTGSADLPPQVYHDVPFMPADFALTAPGLEPVALKPSTDATFTWAVPSVTPPADVTIMSLVAFTGPMGPVVFCVEPNDGSITVPASFVDIARTSYPNGGTMARQTFTHVTRELIDNTGPTGRRIDIISTWCYATAFTVQ